MEEQLVCYKYHTINKYLFDLLINQEFWFSRPKDFNDPFDCNIDLHIEDDDDLIKHLRSTMPNFKKELDTSKRNFQEYKEWLTKSMTEQYEETIGICCFSLNPKNILMWSHYSNNHKGVCLKFDRAKDMDCFRGSYPVEYLNKYPIININKNNTMDAFLKVGTYKSIDWEYEKEIRVLKLDGFGKKSFNIACLREVIFGVNCTAEDQKTIILLLAKLGYPHIKFSRAELESNNFEIKFKEVSPDSKIQIEEEVVKRMEDFFKAEFLQKFSDDLVEKSWDHMLPKYTELLDVICQDLLSRENIEERNKIIEQSLPLNKDEIKSIIEHIEA